MSLSLQQGDIHYGEFSEPIKSRPVVVLSREEINAAREKVIVALITTRIRHIPFEIPVGHAEGLPKESVISLGNIYTIAKSRLSTRSGGLSQEKLIKLKDGLKLMFDIDSDPPPILAE